MKHTVVSVGTIPDYNKVKKVKKIDDVFNDSSNETLTLIGRVKGAMIIVGGQTRHCKLVNEGPNQFFVDKFGNKFPA